MALVDLIEDAVQHPYLLKKLYLNRQSLYTDYELTDREISLLESGDKIRISELFENTKVTSKTTDKSGLSEKPGSLLIVGSGISSVAHLTVEAISAIKAADVVFHLVIDQMTRNWLHQLQQDVRPLYHHYKKGVKRIESYENIVDEIMTEVRRGSDVVALFYGHPGILVYSGHHALKKAHEEKFYARMLPGISANACLIADLGIDPAEGWQSYEATYFLNHDKKIDITTPLLLWQVGALGELTFSPGNILDKAFDGVISKLTALYGAEHDICIYEAPEFSILKPIINWIRLDKVEKKDFLPMSSLFIPPLKKCMG